MKKILPSTSLATRGGWMHCLHHWAKIHLEGLIAKHILIAFLAKDNNKNAINRTRSIIVSKKNIASNKHKQARK